MLSFFGLSSGRSTPTNTSDDAGTAQSTSSLVEVSIPVIFQADEHSIASSEFICAGCFDEYGFFFSSRGRCSFCSRQFCSDCVQRIRQTNSGRIATVDVCQPCLREWIHVMKNSAEKPMDISDREKVNVKDVALPSLFEIQTKIVDKRNETKAALASAPSSLSVTSPTSESSSTASSSPPPPPVAWTPSTVQSHRAELVYSMAETLSAVELQRLIQRLHALARTHTQSADTPAVAVPARLIHRENVHHITNSWEIKHSPSASITSTSSLSSPSSRSPASLSSVGTATTQLQLRANSIDVQNGQLAQLNSLLAQQLNGSSGGTEGKQHARASSEGQQSSASSTPHTPSPRHSSRDSEPASQMNAVRNLLAHSRTQSAQSANLLSTVTPSKLDTDSSGTTEVQSTPAAASSTTNSNISSSWANVASSTPQTGNGKSLFINQYLASIREKQSSASPSPKSGTSATSSANHSRSNSNSMMAAITPKTQPTELKRDLTKNPK